ncbi:carboxylating nicotinate-nucleotide diphosphorylase [Methanohalophilus sp. RSK]|uniref:carboxylating nicotinate-nucleotide diphosphorylase n=1 Tax=Methanohalophilus sp. RSK TaxID=2485783 RepID=UPI000F43A0B8|nr:carboxylating nicotinate-nucleotide diphosphorylase [Methanohalophilus sp. RSK]RNI15334.1 carboxylating nicotinate-nucleotide diphosphorylase [Methanohalophilus sp. RSK]
MLRGQIENFIREDLGYHDISCQMVPDTIAEAVVFAKQDCVIAGVDVAEAIFDYFDIEYTRKVADGERIQNNDVIFELKASTVSLLRAERLSLNFLGHLSGIATLTRDCVETVNQCSEAVVAATRKTTPGIREFEKLAVIAGGGDPHRFNLSDSIMIKDNHRNIMGLENAILKAKEMASFTQKIEAEVESATDAILAAKMGVDIIMLDNMAPSEIISTVEKLRHEGLRNKVIVEVSGGINTENLAEYAKTGIDVISMGSLIHKAQWADLSMEMKESFMS